ncbi:uncharacterized protein BO95DRAFT_438449 [Aspergillus brunneoviolaceus CBS 621.78]|uniref:Uncharacterized protein n=1 Tax=Aspergillus brunneoviolaceus CBS 621.78 TaxID=1450534 RepID=A0ACD1GMT1_9EURO|nr:hypothetical protein BO95DRAFT_438449 [Aspergillus brunneoviolaceus CBS 621.78]RAH50669.1 hypothetical protein BO95DRAFT_438449 [Aspergillus brunneoviolaceus CBS 621.78]
MPAEARLECQARKTRKNYRPYNFSKTADSNRYHWAVHIGPKSPTKQRLGVRYHAKERLTVKGKSEFIFEESEVSPQMPLVRIAVAKILDQDRAVEILRSTATRQNAPEWNCVSWVQEALGALNVDSRALGTRILDWESVRDAAMEYCPRK